MAKYILAAFCAAATYAVPVTVLNPSFENAILPFSYPTGQISNLVSGFIPLGGTVDNWVAIGAQTGDNVGAFDPNNANLNNWTFVWETGNNVAHMQNAANGTLSMGLSQTLTDVYLANTSYTLSVDVGRRQFEIGGASWGYAIELWGGGNLVGTASNLALPLNSAGTDTLNVVIGASGAPIGQNIEVRLLSKGVFSESYFDNVRLSSSADTPEPAGVALLGAGLVLLAARFRLC